MPELIATYPWTMLALAAFVGAILGSLITLVSLRRKNKGQTVAGLAQELDEYRDSVSDHFSTTSELFKDLTEKYRDVYNHLATGSEALCKDPIEHGQLEFRPPQALESSADATDIPAESELSDDVAVPDVDAAPSIDKTTQA